MTNKQMITGGGFKAINYSLRVAGKVGPKNFVRAIFSKNSCKTCALGMGGQRGGMRNENGHFPEICKKSMQAQLTDIQDSIPTSFFQKNDFSFFQKMSGRELEQSGRLNTPLYKAPESEHYLPLDWDSALKKIIERLKNTDPERSFFYASGRSANEAAFILQLFVRLFGTNNVNNCSYYCHQASGVGLNTTIGTGTATIQLDDLAKSDLIFVIGANPASNHPRFMRELMLCRRRGGNVIIINPAIEPGLVKFAVPSDLRSMLAGGSEISSLYLQPNIGGDIALLKGIAKIIIEKNKTASSFIEKYTNNYPFFAEDVLAEDWETIVNSSGVAKEQIEKAAELYLQAENVVFSWAMGITHHQYGVANVEAIANLSLLRGMVGRKYAGLLPLRGHSNVQGIGSVGLTPVLKEKIFQNIEENLQVKLPLKPGMDTMACMQAAALGNIDFALMLGGNLYSSNPDSAFARKALDNIPFKVFLNTTLNQGHFYGTEKGESLILPVAARDEEKQKTTQESMFNFVRLSDGGIVRLDNVRSETEIIAEIAAGVLGNNKIDFGEFKNHQKIREAIAKVIPGFSEIVQIDHTGNEFQISGRTLHQPEFSTPDQKANFVPVRLPEIALEKDCFRMMTIRSEGQFNSIVYDEEDLYRQQKDRWVVLMNPEDIQLYGFTENELVDLESATGFMPKVRLRPFSIRQGNIMTYYPEANCLVSRDLDPRSKTPSFKMTPVRVKKSLNI